MASIVQAAAGGVAKPVHGSFTMNQLQNASSILEDSLRFFAMLMGDDDASLDTITSYHVTESRYREAIQHAHAFSC